VPFDTNSAIRRRYALGLQQRELAEIVGVTKSHIHLIEAGKRQPSPALLVRLADAFGCEPSDLMVEDA
jgi:transcriptional regulator with XRE-family HTH domain